jgi:selenocysteine lyase/cysteine desulfurase
VPIDVKANNIDILCFSCFKWLLSPYGMGCFYCDQRIIDQVTPTEVGDRSGTISAREADAELKLAQDANRFESGNINYPGVYGLSAALDMINDLGVERIHQRILGNNRVLIEGLSGAGLKVTSPSRDDLRSAIVSFSVDDPETIVQKLWPRGIRVSVRGGGIRVSPHFYNAEEEIKTFIERVSEFV